nr:hypothetical protein [uncultured Roseateles sp.]
MVSLAFTLLITAAISFPFRHTRGIGIACLSLFCFLFPWGALALLLTAGVAFLIYFYYYR